MTAVRKTIAATATDVVERLADMGIHLDGSEASLQAFDAAIEALWGEVQPADEFFDGMVWGYGCYVADIIQRHHVGEWQASDDAGYDFTAPGDLTSINPWQWVERRFQLGDPLAASYQSMVRRKKP